MIGLYVLIGLVVVGLVWAISVYNGLIVLRQRASNAWSQVEVQLRRRYDLIDNLVETVRGYMDHERETLLSVTQARQQAARAESVAEQQEAERGLDEAVGRLVNVVVENYPQLRASENFQELQASLQDTENKIAFARQFYNDTVQKFNIRVELFPGNIIAGMLGFETRPYFDAPAEAEEPVDVKF